MEEVNELKKPTKIRKFNQEMKMQLEKEREIYRQSR